MTKPEPYRYGCGAYVLIALLFAIVAILSCNNTRDGEQAQKGKKEYRVAVMTELGARDTVYYESSCDNLIITEGELRTCDILGKTIASNIATFNIIK